jgi:hypothetical protein
LSFALVQSLLVGFSPEWGELLEDGVEFIAGDASEALKGNGALLKSGDAEHLESVTSRALSRNSSSHDSRNRRPFAAWLCARLTIQFGHLMLNQKRAERTQTTLESDILSCPQ